LREEKVGFKKRRGNKSEREREEETKFD